MGKFIILLGAHGPSLVNFRGPLISALIKAGHRVTAAAIDIDEATATSLRALGAEPLSLTAQRTGMNPFSDLGFHRQLKAHFTRLRPDIVLAYTAKPIVWGAPAARAAGVPFFAAMITGLGYAFTDGRDIKRRVVLAVLKRLYRRALRRSDAIMFQNPDDRALFEVMKLVPAQPGSVIINGSGIDLSHFALAPLPMGQPSFLMIARFLGDKGVREYCQAAIATKRRHPAIHFRLVGWIDPSPNAIGEEELAGWIAEGVEYLGRQDDIRPAMRGTSVYVLPSYREGTPRSVLEALAMGRPVITTDAPGCRETVVDGHNGYLVPARDAEAIERAMLRFIENPTLVPTMGQASRRIAEEKYDVHKVNLQIMEHLGIP
jgi:glycosyltransferase involved in cell wall biosynthesis